MYCEIFLGLILVYFFVKNRNTEIWKIVEKKIYCDNILVNHFELNGLYNIEPLVDIKLKVINDRLNNKTYVVGLPPFPLFVKKNKIHILVTDILKNKQYSKIFTDNELISLDNLEKKEVLMEGYD